MAEAWDDVWRRFHVKQRTAASGFGGGVELVSIETGPSWSRRSRDGYVVRRLIRRVSAGSRSASAGNVVVGSNTRLVGPMVLDHPWSSVRSWLPIPPASPVEGSPAEARSASSCSPSRSDSVAGHAEGKAESRSTIGAVSRGTPGQPNLRPVERIGFGQPRPAEMVVRSSTDVLTSILLALDSGSPTVSTRPDVLVVARGPRTRLSRNRQRKEAQPHDRGRLHCRGGPTAKTSARSRAPRSSADAAATSSAAELPLRARIDPPGSRSGAHQGINLSSGATARAMTTSKRPR